MCLQSHLRWLAAVTPRSSKKQTSYSPFLRAQAKLTSDQWNLNVKGFPFFFCSRAHVFSDVLKTHYDYFKSIIPFWHGSQLSSVALSPMARMAAQPVTEHPSTIPNGASQHIVQSAGLVHGDLFNPWPRSFSLQALLLFCSSGSHLLSLQKLVKVFF